VRAAVQRADGTKADFERGQLSLIAGPAVPYREPDCLRDAPLR
jgi:hypothetical protein